jgi:hypothetical protein
MDVRDVRMIQRRENLCFSFEAGESISVNLAEVKRLG